jgi:hypothetical protein
MSKKLNEKHLNEHQCYEIILKLNKMNVLSIKTLAWEYNVSEGAIWKVWDNWEAILERYALLSKKVKERTFRAFVGRFTELEDMLYIWIDNMRCAKLPVPPSFTITKVKSIASSLFIPKSNFKASWQWLSQFRACCGLQRCSFTEREQKSTKTI